MNVSKLVVLPTQETLDLLKDMFQATAVEINWDSLHVELGSSTESISAYPDSPIYLAKPGSLGMWYDAPTSRSWMILPLIPSDVMLDRHKEIGDAWGRKTFVPFMALCPDQGLRRKARGVINSIATGLVDLSPTLSFHNETSFVTNDFWPSHNGFYEDYLARGGVSNEVFLMQDHGDE